MSERLDRMTAWQRTVFAAARAGRGWAFAEEMAGPAISDDTGGPEGFRAIEESSFVQAELASQVRDLDDLAALTEPEAADLDFLRRRGSAL